MPDKELCLREALAVCTPPVKATLTLADEGQEWLSFHRANIWCACRGVLLMAIDLGFPGFIWGGGGVTWLPW